VLNFLQNKNKKKAAEKKASPKAASQNRVFGPDIDVNAEEWIEIPSGHDVVSAERDVVKSLDHKVKFHFRENIHELTKVLKRMGDELVLAVQQRDKKIARIQKECKKYKTRALQYRDKTEQLQASIDKQWVQEVVRLKSELAQYKEKAEQLEKTIHQQWDEEVFRASNEEAIAAMEEELTKSKIELEKFKKKTAQLDRTVRKHEENSYSGLLRKFDQLVRDVLVKRTMNNEEKMQTLILVSRHMGIPHSQSIQMIRSMVNKIMGQVRRF